MKTTPVASGAPAVSPKKQRAAAAAAPTPAPAPAALLPAAAAAAGAAATAPAVGRSSKKKRRGVHPDAPPPSPPPAGPSASSPAAAGATPAAPAAAAAKKANPTPGRVARAAAHVAERASVDGPLFTDPAEFLRAAHSRWARNQLPGSEPPSKEVAAVGRLPADRVAVVPAPVALTDVAAVVDSAVKSTEFGRQLRPLTAAGVDPPPAVAKLFSKHIKLEENVATLEAAAASTLAHVPLAVGTPARVLALLEAGALALLRSTLVVVDVSRDVKERMVVDSPDTGDAFMRILGRHLAPSGCSLFLFRDRGVEAEKQAAARKAKGQ
ncbi:hypothetical protein I4F81_012196 [Pyropia yezoensis]|uniref:Uncharacterized protein n=1 Tax=Pyropia yezoensis TaxID=2788 RepID=A0ACC3CHT1_PYRYE|nr:hypothetical protein I4F81_012196 [Neopyropia yezoensis]